MKIDGLVHEGRRSVSGMTGLCLWIVQAFLYRVQGHVHMTLQSMCNV